MKIRTWWHRVTGQTETQLRDQLRESRAQTSHAHAQRYRAEAELQIAEKTISDLTEAMNQAVNGEGDAWTRLSRLEMFAAEALSDQVTKTKSLVGTFDGAPVFESEATIEWAAPMPTHWYKDR